MFLSRDVLTENFVRERSVGGLLPLLVPGLPGDVAETLLDTVHGPHFGLGTETRLVPSYDLLGHAYDASRYWRGPAWFNINWALARGLRQYGAQDSADRLAAAILTTAAASGFAEYVDARTREPHGSSSFAWTAALTLDILADPAAGRSPGAAVVSGRRFAVHERAAAPAR
jgi:glycogen debranching enzyme